MFPNDLEDLGIEVDGINIGMISANKVHPFFGKLPIVELFLSNLGLAPKDGMIFWGGWASLFSTP